MEKWIFIGVICFLNSPRLGTGVGEGAALRSHDYRPGTMFHWFGLQSREARLRRVDDLPPFSRQAVSGLGFNAGPLSCINKGVKWCQLRRALVQGCGTPRCCSKPGADQRLRPLLRACMGAGRLSPLISMTRTEARQPRRAGGIQPVRKAP